MRTEEVPVGMLIKQIGEKLTQKSNSILLNEELTMSQIHLMHLIAKSDNGELSMKVAEKQLNMAQSTVAGIASRLVSKGLIAYDVQEDDHRKKLLCITEAGWKVLNIGRDKMISVEENLVSALTEEEQKDFRRMLNTILNSIQQEKETAL